MLFAGLTGHMIDAMLDALTGDMVCVVLGKVRGGTAWVMSVGVAADTKIGQMTARAFLSAKLALEATSIIGDIMRPGSTG